MRDLQISGHVAVGQNQWYHVGVGAPPILVYFSGDWDVHWEYFNPWPCLLGCIFETYMEHRPSKPYQSHAFLQQALQILATQSQGLSFLIVHLLS